MLDEMERVPGEQVGENEHGQIPLCHHWSHTHYGYTGMCLFTAV